MILDRFYFKRLDALPNTPEAGYSLDRAVTAAEAGETWGIYPADGPYDKPLAVLMPHNWKAYVRDD